MPGKWTCRSCLWVTEPTPPEELWEQGQNPVWIPTQGRWTPDSPLLRAITGAINSVSLGSRISSNLQRNPSGREKQGLVWEVWLAVSTKPHWQGISSTSSLFKVKTSVFVIPDQKHPFFCAQLSEGKAWARCDLEGESWLAGAYTEHFHFFAELKLFETLQFEKKISSNV